MTMRGIISYGAYVPFKRLRREAIGATLGSRAPKGTRAVASHDEDTTTLGVEAARIAARRAAGPAPEMLWFATASPAYLDKTNATAIHAALDLPASTLALDTGGALRSGLGSLIAALHGGRRALVVAADVRTGLPGGVDEAQGGDAGAAFLVGSAEDGPVLAEHLGDASASAELMDRWRLPGDRVSQTWEERFGEVAYRPLAEDAMARALAAAQLKAEDLSRVIVTGTHARAARAVAKAIGAGEVLADDLTGVVGHSGTAHAGLLLAAALDRAEPGDAIAVVSLADGADVVIFRATDALVAARGRGPSVAELLEATDDSLDYATFLTWRGFLERQPPRRPDPDAPAAPPALRSAGWKFGFTGSRDRSTGVVHLPPQRVSLAGGAVDEMESVRRADALGTIATYTVDRLAYSLAPPVVVAVVDFDEGGRFTGELTDVDPERVAIGDRVELTFRRTHTARGIHNYFWKGRPVRLASIDGGEG